MAYTKLWPVRGSYGNGKMVVGKVVEYDMNEAKTTEKIAEKDVIEIDISGKVNDTLTSDQVTNIISYTSDSDKVGEQRYITAINCTEENCIEEMCYTKQHFGERGNRVMYHGVQSFKPGEIVPEQAHKIGVKLAEELWGDRFEVVVTTHLDRHHIHNHFAINSVSFIDGKKLVWDTEYKKMQQVSDRLCREASLNIINRDEESGHSHRGVMRAASEGRYTLEGIVKEDIDVCIKCSKSINDWFSLMESKGYRVNTERKYLRVYPYGHDKPIRIDRRFKERYGEDYTIDGIKAKIMENLAQGGYIDARNLGNIGADSNIGYLIEKRDLKDSNGKEIKSYGFKNPVKVTGIQKTYNRYLIILGVYPSKHRTGRAARTHYLLREDLLKLDKYINQNNFLISRGITDTEALKETRKAEAYELSQMYQQRNKLRNRIRRADESVLPDLRICLSEANALIKSQKKIVFYCNDILRNVDDMARKIMMSEEINSDKKNNNKDMKYNENERR